MRARNDVIGYRRLAPCRSHAAFKFLFRAFELPCFRDLRLLCIGQKWLTQGDCPRFVVPTNLGQSPGAGCPT